MSNRKLIRKLLMKLIRNLMRKRIQKPIRKLLRKDKHFTWSDQYQAEFDRLKQEMSSIQFQHDDLNTFLEVNKILSFFGGFIKYPIFSVSVNVQYFLGRTSEKTPGGGGGIGFGALPFPPLLHAPEPLA